MIYALTFAAGCLTVWAVIAFRRTGRPRKRRNIPCRDWTGDKFPQSPQK